jgi:hypothetical protein
VRSIERLMRLHYLTRRNIARRKEKERRKREREGKRTGE